MLRGYFNAIGKVEVEHEREYLELKRCLMKRAFLRATKKISGFARCADTFIEAKKLQALAHFAKLQKSILNANF